MTPTITRILVPTDFSETSDAALEWAKTIAETLGASLHLLHVFEDPLLTGACATVDAYPPDAAAMAAALLQDANERLAHRLSADEKARFRATAEILTGITAPAIVDYARNQNIDLVVMGTHGRTGLAHLVMGSVAERVVQRAPCPVLTVPRHPVATTQPARAYLPEFPLQIPA